MSTMNMDRSRFNICATAAPSTFRLGSICGENVVAATIHFFAQNPKGRVHVLGVCLHVSDFYVLSVVSTVFSGRVILLRLHQLRSLG